MEKRVKKMSDITLFAVKISNNSETLKNFDEALRKIKDNNCDTETRQKNNLKLLHTIQPLSDNLKGKLTATPINENEIIEIMKEKHINNWQHYETRLFEVTKKLEEEKKLENPDFDILNDVADALDKESANLYKRMGQRR